MIGLVTRYKEKKQDLIKQRDEYQQKYEENDKLEWIKTLIPWYDGQIETLDRVINDLE